MKMRPGLWALLGFAAILGFGAITDPESGKTSYTHTVAERAHHAHRSH